MYKTDIGEPLKFLCREIENLGYSISFDRYKYSKESFAILLNNYKKIYYDQETGYNEQRGKVWKNLIKKFHYQISSLIELENEFKNQELLLIEQEADKSNTDN